MRELAPPGLHPLFRVFLKVDGPRARDDRFRGPEIIANSKRPKMVVSRRRNTCLLQVINTASREMLSSRRSACQAPPRRLPEAIRVAAATRTDFWSSDGNSDFEHARKRVFGGGQTTISALAVSKCLESERFARTRRHFTKKVRFVIALVITGRRPRPGIATKRKRIWPRSGATFVVVSRMNLARGGS